MSLKAAAFEFARKVDEEIESLTNTEYLRSQGNGKWLREEAYPISRLGLFLKRPGLNVSVESFNDSGPRDGRITIDGFWKAEFDVEVGISYSYEESLRQELLCDTGSAPGAGKISRNKSTKEIDAEFGAVDYEAYISKTAESIGKLFVKKRDQYAPGESLLILVFNEIKLCGRTRWAQLFESLDSVVDFTPSPFKRVFLLNAATNELHMVA